jgi:iron complex transport system substrate-binding protein
MFARLDYTRRVNGIRYALCFLALLLSCRTRSPASDGATHRTSMATLDPNAAPVRRVVSLVPSATETLFALGAGDRVVAVSAFDDWPPEATRLPRVGGMTNPSFEAIVSTHPDAIVGVQGPLDMVILDRLQSMGIRVFFPRVESLAEVMTSIDSFGTLVGRRDAAHTLRASINADLTRVRHAVSTQPRVRVIAVFGERPLSVAGPGSWVDEILGVAGGENVVRAGGRYPTLSIEQLLTLAPEVILDMTWQEQASAPLAQSLARYTTLPAVRNGRVLRAADTMLLRPGPRIGAAVLRIAHLLHPEVLP